MVEGDTYLSRVSIRHTLNARLREFGGHIGYEIRPSVQRQGYGKLLLALALDRARALGLTRRDRGERRRAGGRVQACLLREADSARLN
ncbi:GNAT family N-acetyltransferase [Deinococcus sp. YIM 77859]|uniref:GNAT family N-acetyltransferase n=1 Tax=Deinococcus sp. YIM 77859 TaxID=1540221 RepID=UPI00350E34A7